MSRYTQAWTIALILLIALLGCGSDDPALPGGGGDDPGGDDPPVTTLCADNTCTGAFAAIPGQVLADAAADLRLFYGHTSHGSQLMDGLDMLEAEDPSLVQPSVREYPDDLGHLGDVTWDPITRDVLDDPRYDYNVVVWSWCGGASDNTYAGITTYLETMARLEADYPDVTFIYMTGHLDGSGVDGNLYANNDHIRAWCAANDKWLFDFADIESYDPDGTYYPDESDGCGWCTTWCASHNCEPCGSCAHSHCFNCYRKGQAFWWLLARINGWEG
ncbi:hypothetical protein DRQ50_07340 [bacterium]|nr:MAG: hypothetical protein DRQ50_07340 [bacterium]